MRLESWRLDTAGRTARGRVLCLIGQITADPAPWPGVQGLAECAAVTVRTLSRAFARETGMSPARFLERSRVRLACALLEERAWLGSTVARRAGFGSDERMRRAFQRVVGMSPRAYVTRVAERCASTGAALSIPRASACEPPRPTPMPR